MSANAAAGAPLQRVESYQYPNTHIGHLSSGQAAALDKFKAICAQHGYFKEASAGLPASHDDETLLRYLRARKFIPQEAYQQFKETEDWRKANRIEELYDTIDVHDYDETRRLYPQWTGRRDKRGIPVYVFEVAHLNHKRMSAYEKSISGSQKFGTVPPKLMRLFALYENLVRFTLPLCSGIPDRPYSETPVSQSNNIVDISGVGLKQFWNLKEHMQDASTLATAHYPETLDRIFIIGAPSFFPTVWGWVKRWFDPITVSKIFILSQSEVKSTLEKFIDSSNIPKKYGGKLDWEWGTYPNLDPAIVEKIKWEHPGKDERGLTCFPAGPVRWKTNSKGDMVAVAVGTEKGKRRQDTVGVLPIEKKELNIPRSYSIFGLPTTSGTHTHPDEGQEYFPRSGNTPTEEREFNLPTREHKTLNTVEPSTVGEAPKDVSIPQVQSEASASNESYVDQAKAVANSAYTTTAAVIGSAGSTVAAAVGYGSPEKKEEESPVSPGKAEDPRVDQLPSKDVEEFIRSKYTTHNNMGQSRG